VLCKQIFVNFVKKKIYIYIYRETVTFISLLEITRDYSQGKQQLHFKYCKTQMAYQHLNLTHSYWQMVEGVKLSCIPDSLLS